MTIERECFGAVVDHRISLNDKGLMSEVFKYMHPDITDNTFPPHSGGGEHDAYFVGFDEAVTTDQATAEMDKDGLRPGTVREAYALMKRHPELKEKCPILVLDTFVPKGEGVNRIRQVPVILHEEIHGEQGLMLNLLSDFEEEWYPHFRFLAYVKREIVAEDE